MKIKQGDKFVSLYDPKEILIVMSDLSDRDRYWVKYLKDEEQSWLLGISLEKNFKRISEEVMKEEEEETSKAGVKYDGDKTQFGLLPPNALEAIADILTFGAKKYSPGNWKKLDNLEDRYFDALMRHMWAIKKGEKIDPESGKSHYAHAGCCIMFLLENELTKEK
jgi:hypothetical protein